MDLFILYNANFDHSNLVSGVWSLLSLFSTWGWLNYSHKLQQVFYFGLWISANWVTIFLCILFEFFSSMFSECESVNDIIIIYNTFLCKLMSTVSLFELSVDIQNKWNSNNQAFPRTNSPISDFLHMKIQKLKYDKFKFYKGILTLQNLN